MSNTHQDENAPQPEHTVVSNTRHLATESTPVKKKYGPDLTFASETKNFKEIRSQLGKEMDGRWVGPMPVDDFLKEFLHPTDAPLPDIPEDPFKKVPEGGVESARYEPFVSTRLFPQHQLCDNATFRSPRPKDGCLTFML